jgi:hypothetical protein
VVVDIVLTARDPQRRAIQDRIATTRVVRAHVAVPVTEPAGSASPSEVARALVAA